jgi:ABC-type Mn2+/Zn2+ transport system permease subunit/Mn-dependent DtxR family transcriptional regulator
MEDVMIIFQYEPFERALIASCLVGLMCGVLGCFIVLRNMSLIGDALAHAILPGVVFAFMLVGYSRLGFFTGAVLAGLAAAACITWIQHKVSTKNDAAIGIVFTAMFSIGVMGISWISRNEGVHLDLKDFLFGNVLGVSDEDLYLTSAITVYVFISIIVFYRYLFVSTFQPIIAQTMGISVQLIHYFLMLLLSFAVVASLQTVGVILVVAMLITPASTALLLSTRLQRVIALSALFGLISAVLGLYLAIRFETTPGPAMAVTATLIYLLAVFFAPEKGLVFRFFRRLKQKSRIQQEDILKQAFRLQETGELNRGRLLQKLDFGRARFLRRLQQLRKRRLITPDGLTLTEKGVHEAKRLVRAHRLWETYLADRIGLNTEQIHDEAEEYEHLLSDEILDEVDKVLGFPTTDPHGSPIPAKLGLPDFPLTTLPEGQTARIAAQQQNEYITSRLWEWALLPQTEFTIRKKGTEVIEVELKDHTLNIPVEAAKLINVEERDVV